MNESLDFYCERCDAGFWAEPLNAVSNLSFIVAALVAFRIAKRENGFSRSVGTLIGLSLAVGCGSFIFHTIATRWAMALDVGPIFAFQVCFLWMYLRDVARLSVGLMIATTTLFLIANFAVLGLPRYLNGSLMYGPTYVLVMIFTAYHHWAEKPAAAWTVGLFLGLTISLFFRTIDMAICQHFPLGTHFLWHLINGWVLFAPIMIVIRNQRTSADTTADTMSNRPSRSN